MTRTRSITFLASATVPVLAALAVAGCGSSGGSNASRSSAPPKTANGQSATVGVANENLGKILVDSQGRTLYLFRSGLWHEERVHRRLRNRLAATAGDRQADGRRRSDCFDRRDQRPLGRKTTGHLQRPPALPLLGRPEARRHERRGRERLRRPVVRALFGG